MADKQEKIIKPNMSKFYVMAIIAFIVSFWLIKQGITNYRAFAPMGDKSALFSLCYLPILLGSTIVLITVLIYIFNASKKITITPTNIIFFSGGKEISIVWKDLIYTMSPPEKKTFRQITISNGRYFEKIDDFFFPEYNFLAEIIHTAKDASKKETFHV